MPSPLLSPTALAAIRKIGEGQMTTEVQIIRSTLITVDSPEYDPEYDYGDDEFEPAEADLYEGQIVGDALAWFVSDLQRNIQSDQGQMTTIDIHTVRLPVGTDVRPQDIIRRVDNGEEFIVIDTNTGDTWAEKMKVSVRRREG